ncbi:hypothetical protein AS850_15860 [Frondihabitans sp. 762G35]|uniref:hypothetical protein n=1 Tax=Frondihabitans sp. 762G35 TaxID=1446794 RepID=UPI000D21A43E|nr:hypothetical protein [Frondihabitans sp. 762G35]ARC58564.1 hypothetical protein AS850_15860 [Frondihabitans sp. 762G35]
MRIVRTRYKVLYLLGFGAIGFALSALLNAVDGSGLAAAVASILLNGLLVVAVRCFRVPEEDIAAPRPWWRMTGRPTAGFLLGTVYGLSGLGYAVFAVLGRLPAATTPEEAVQGTPFFVVVDTLIALAWAVLYLRSSRRLARVGGPAVDFPADRVGFGGSVVDEGR